MLHRSGGGWLYLAALALVMASTVRVEATAPTVAKAVPDNGATDVDPSLREIRVTFDRPMDTGGMSFVGGGPNYPKVTARGRWVDARTCVLPVELAPEHEYWLSINSATFTNFRNRQGEPAVPYPIQFKTGKAGGRATPTTAPAGPTPGPTPADHRAAAAELRRAIQEDYSYRDLRQVDWEARFKEYGPALEQAASAKDFAATAAKLLAPAQDAHLWIEAGNQPYAPFVRQVPRNVNLRTLARLVPGWTDHDSAVATGKFEGDVGYIMIATWSSDAEKALEPAYQMLGGPTPPKALIVDVRPNAGGSEALALQFAGCFTAKPVLYSKNQYMQAGKFGPVLERVLAPNRGRPAYRGKVVVLMGRANLSSCESFLLMMRASGAMLLGEKSYGSSGNPKPNLLANGVTVYLPSWKDMLPDGTVLEGRGIDPDVKVPAKPEDFAERDPVLEAALKLLRP